MGPKEGIDAKDVSYEIILNTNLCLTYTKFQLSLRYTCEVVSDCVLGLQANSFTDKSAPIYQNAKKLFDQSFVIILYMTLAGLIPGITKIKKLSFIPKNMQQFFLDVMEQSISLRKSQLENGVNEERVDFMNYILQLKEKKNLTVPQVTSHTMTFLVDGFETTASVLSHCLLLVMFLN